MAFLLSGLSVVTPERLFLLQKTIAANWPEHGIRTMLRQKENGEMP